MDDITTALVLKHTSSKAFQYLRPKKLIALPGQHSLERYLQHFKCEGGLLFSSFKLLDKMMDNLEDSKAKWAVLTFDEISTRKCFEYCGKTRKVFGPNKKLQVAMVRSLTHAWKQPIFADFDVPMTKTLLFQTEKVGIQVVGITFDLGNKTIVSELDLTPDKFSFCHPTSPDREIFAFQDVPHLLKLFRNHLLDEGYELRTKTGTYVSLDKSDFEKLLDNDNNELQIAFKVTSELHLNCTGSARQRVRTAAQLLSHTVAKA